MKGFKDFIMRGNVLDLAIGVVIGGAFTALIDAFVSNLIQPVINVAGTPDTGGLAFQLRPGVDGTTMDIGALISAIISFLITAAVVYFVFVMPMAKAQAMARRKKGLPEFEEDPVAEDVQLLAEIRDLLKSNGAVANNGPTAADGSASGYGQPGQPGQPLA